MPRLSGVECYLLKLPQEGTLISMTEELCIRKARLDDGGFVFATKKQAFREYVEHVWGWDESRQRELHNTRFAKHDFRIIRIRGIDVGFFATSNTSEALRLHQLFILPEYQGRGIGSACMTRIVNRANIAKKPVMLQVLKINARAAAFYQRIGFDVAGTISATST
ncbi:MAG: GNAT family N-acetyltransferase [Candidatus Poribacteria bacterium]|nr:GNAT family N-acetyltransferase [Candidatus Poribacteria bacterium]MDE0505685.1 GNAT family N-acetyltransferase [Candidatus Poribacteria bacterium]